jgi:hypothetical protein
MLKMDGRFKTLSGKRWEKAKPYPQRSGELFTKVTLMALTATATDGGKNFLQAGRANRFYGHA